MWVNNLDSLEQNKSSNSKSSDNVQATREKKTGITYIPGLDKFEPAKIVMPPALEGYEQRIDEMIKREKEIQIEILKLQNEDLVLKKVSAGSTELPTESEINMQEIGSINKTNGLGIKLTQSTARDDISKIKDQESELFDKDGNSIPRDMLASRRGYQLKKLENSKAGFIKKVRGLGLRLGLGSNCF